MVNCQYIQNDSCIDFFSAVASHFHPFVKVKKAVNLQLCSVNPVRCNIHDPFYWPNVDTIQEWKVMYSLASK